MADYEYIVEMNHITKRFPGIIANDDVSIKIKKGEIYAILGENGAGKSTLMSMLFGMYEPDEGEIILRGNKVRISSPNVANDLNIGMVHQHFRLVSNYTIAQNIVMGDEPIKKLFGFIPVIDEKKANEKIEELSNKYGLMVNPTNIVETLSVSTKQRVEILKMLYREAEILIFDEPTAVLTPQEIDFLLNIIRNLRDAGKTIILITHKLDEIKKVADRCAILNRGKLIDVLDVKTSSTKDMANMMVGREVSFQTPKKEAKFGKTILSVKNLVVKNIDDFPVVNDVSFEIHEGEVFSIAGVAGNGQVEIADAIYGLLKVASGCIMFQNKDITDDSIRSRVEKGISYIPEDRQAYGVVLDFYLKDNLVTKEYYRKKYSEKGVLKHHNINKNAKELIDSYDIRSGQGIDTVVRSMSGGNQQKVIIAREIELDSNLMIFVQPTRGLDVGAIENIRKQIIEQRDKGKAILLVSLELDEIMDISDTIGVIYNGKIQKIAPAKELTKEEVGEFMMGVKKKGDNNNV
ncbi:MAG: ABC transporter ATP-binding protein [Lachnospiraceae bacterium]|nr:ABC transporter ATP-binding protein [Lachnospiraceae bacterium]